MDVCKSRLLVLISGSLSLNLCSQKSAESYRGDVTLLQLRLAVYREEGGRIFIFHPSFGVEQEDRLEQLQKKLCKCWVVLTQFWVKYGQTQPLG